MTTQTLGVLLLAACAGPAFELHTASPTLSGPGEHAVAIVRVKAPWYAPRFLIARKFRAAVPEYEAVAGLETKYFTISDDREFGGFYSWTTRAAAAAFYTDAWRRGICERRGTDPDLLVFDAPYVFAGRATIRGKPLGTRSLEYAATATLVLAPTGDPRAIADAAKDLEGLVRGEAIVGAAGVGFVALWVNRELAEAALARFTGVTYFEAPVVMDQELAAPSR